MLEVTTIGSHAGNQGFFLHQDVPPAHMVRVMHQANCPGSLKRITLPKLSRFEPTGLSCGAILEKYYKLQLKL